MSFILERTARGGYPSTPLPSGKIHVGDNLAIMRSGVIESASVRLCYLDPPFNTGETFTHYQDAVPSERWAEDLLARVQAIAPLLTDDASIWLHLDDREQHVGRLVLEEVFGREAFVATVIWQRKLSRDNRVAFSRSHDYLHVFAPAGPRAWKTRRNGLPDTGAYSNPDDDPRGPWRSVPMSVQAGHATPSQFYEIVTPTGAVHSPPRGRCWTYTAERFRELERDGRVYWPRKGAGIPRLKRYQVDGSALVPSTLWMAEEVGDTGEAKREVLRESADGAVFDTPKPLRLMERVIGISTDPGDLVLDPYAGSGTTLVAADLADRRWVGVEREAQTVESIIVPRLRARDVPFDVHHSVDPVSSGD
ncbi:site-specific DNA-methyltransferase [Microbacterium sp. C23T]